ncbi:MAG: LysR family transcriptional regulator [Streptococcus sp.]
MLCYTRYGYSDFHYFVTIAQEKNITRAAERLLITQPTHLDSSKVRRGIRCFFVSSSQS